MPRAPPSSPYAPPTPNPPPAMFDSLDPFRRRSVALALYRMLTGDRFSICTVRDALTVTGTAYDRAHFEAVRLHNGAPYAEMPGGFHAELASQTLALFHGRPVLGDGFLKDLAAAAGLQPQDAPALQRLAHVTAAA